VLFTIKLSLDSFMFFQKESEGVLEVSLTLNQNLIIILKVVNKVFNEEEVVGVKSR